MLTAPQGADEEVREAKVWMSYYLTYGEAPTSTETLTEYGASIGLGSGVSHTSGSKAYQNYCTWFKKTQQPQEELQIQQDKQCHLIDLKQGTLIRNGSKNRYRFVCIQRS